MAIAAEEMPNRQTYVCPYQLFGLKITTVICNIAEQLSNQLRYRQENWHAAPVSLQPPLGHGKIRHYESIAFHSHPERNVGRTEPLPEEFFGPFPARSEECEYRPTRNPGMQLGQTCQKTKEGRFAIRVNTALGQHTNTW